MLDIEIRGAEEFGTLSRRLKSMGDDGKGLRKELYAGLNRAAKPARAAVKESILSELPRRGGLADLIASDTKVTFNKRGLGRNPSIRITSKSPHEIRKLNQGILRHPLFGNRKVWQSQKIPAGAFTDPIEKLAPQMRVEMEQVIRTVAAKIEGHS